MFDSKLNSMFDYLDGPKTCQPKYLLDICSQPYFCTSQAQTCVPPTYFCDLPKSSSVLRRPSQLYYSQKSLGFALPSGTESLVHELDHQLADRSRAPPSTASANASITGTRWKWNACVWNGCCCHPGWA